MIELIEANWLVALIALLLGLLVAWYVFHASRRTRVTGTRRDVLDDGAAPAERNRALIDAPPAALRDQPAPAPAPVTPVAAPPAPAKPVEAEAKPVAPASAPPPPPQPAAAAGAPDDLARIKGVGPKLVTLLHELGITRFAQIAAWDDAEIDRIDSQLGRFQGRIRRDNWIEQARFLAAGDTEGFAGRFGKLS